MCQTLSFALYSSVVRSLHYVSRTDILETCWCGVIVLRIATANSERKVVVCPYNILALRTSNTPWFCCHRRNTHFTERSLNIDSSARSGSVLIFDFSALSGCLMQWQWPSETPHATLLPPLLLELARRSPRVVSDSYTQFTGDQPFHNSSMSNSFLWTSLLLNKQVSFALTPLFSFALTFTFALLGLPPLSQQADAMWPHSPHVMHLFVPTIIALMWIASAGLTPLPMWLHQRPSAAVTVDGRSCPGMWPLCWQPQVVL